MGDPVVSHNVMLDADHKMIAIIRHTGPQTVLVLDDNDHCPLSDFRPDAACTRARSSVD